MGVQAEGLGGGSQGQLGLRLLTPGRRVHSDVLGSRHRVNTARLSRVSGLHGGLGEKSQVIKLRNSSFFFVKPMIVL